MSADFSKDAKARRRHSLVLCRRFFCAPKRYPLDEDEKLVYTFLCPFGSLFGSCDVWLFRRCRRVRSSSLAPSKRVPSKHELRREALLRATLARLVLSRYSLRPGDHRVATTVRWRRPRLPRDAAAAAVHVQNRNARTRWAHRIFEATVTDRQAARVTPCRRFSFCRDS